MGKESTPRKISGYLGFPFRLPSKNQTFGSLKFDRPIYTEAQDWRCWVSGSLTWHLHRLIWSALEGNTPHVDRPEKTDFWCFIGPKQKVLPSVCSGRLKLELSGAFPLQKSPGAPLGAERRRCRSDVAMSRSRHGAGRGRLLQLHGAQLPLARRAPKASGPKRSERKRWPKGAGRR